MIRRKTVLAVGLLVASLLPNLYIDTGYLAYILQFTAIAPITGILLSHQSKSFDGEIVISTQTTTVGAICLLSSVFAIHYIQQLFQGFSLGLTFRALSFTVCLLVFVILLPNIIPKEDFLTGLALVSASLVVIGLPALFIGPIQFVGILLPQWTPAAPTGIDGVLTLDTILLSVLNNPNTLAKWTFFGFAAALYFSTGEDTSQQRFGLATLAITSLGLFFTFSRAALLATIISITVYLIFQSGHQRTAATFSVVSIAGTTWLLLVLLGFIPVFDAIPTINLHGRYELWTTTLDVARTHPIIGYGPYDASELLAPYLSPHMTGRSPHNSYLRVVLTTGIVGVTAYLSLHIEAMQSIFASTTSDENAAIAALFSGILVLQLFDAFTILGLGSISIVSAMVVGYCLTANQKKFSTIALPIFSNQVFKTSLLARILLPSQRRTLTISVKDSIIVEALLSAMQSSKVSHLSRRAIALIQAAWTNSEFRKFYNKII